jgi:hypothetical protein
MPLLQFLAVVPLFVGGQEDRLITALAYLTSGVVEADVVAELQHRFMPGERVEILEFLKRAQRVNRRGDNQRPNTRSGLARLAQELAIARQNSPELISAPR